MKLGGTLAQGAWTSVREGLEGCKWVSRGGGRVSTGDRLVDRRGWSESDRPRQGVHAVWLVTHPSCLGSAATLTRGGARRPRSQSCGRCGKVELRSEAVQVQRDVFATYQVAHGCALAEALAKLAGLLPAEPAVARSSSAT
jgi:hypothetical protein